MKTIIAACALSILPTLSFAGNSNNYATITSVDPVYKNNYVTRYDNNCYDVDVPIYQERVIRGGGSDGDVFTGAVIGGVLGNQFGNGNGKDVATVLGAILGANRASNKRVQEIVGYRVEQKCESTRKTVNEPTIYKYNISYEYNGYTYTQETTKRYTLGQTVLIQPSLN